MMQIFKVICLALLCVAVIALPSEKFDCDGNCADCDGSCGHQNNGGPKLEWWENAVFYQIYPRSFKDSDGNGIGDINGIIEQLDYLKDLGVDGAWLSPIFKSPMADFGYDIQDFRDIDPMFGTLNDMEKLFKEAANRNIRIILDFVPNHSSDQHEWFKKSVKREGNFTDFYIWADGKNGNKDPPNNWVSVFHGSAWTYNDERKQWYYHAFAKEQPDLNYRNPLVVEAMTDVLNFWLEKGASGFRVDAINHLFEYEDLRDEPLSDKTNDTQSYDYTLHNYTLDLPEVYEMVYKFREIVDKFQADKGIERPILMTEAYTNATEYVKYFKSADGKKLGSQMPFNFALISDLNRYSSANDFKQIIDDKIESVPNGTRLNWVMGNHDKPRVGSRYGERRIDGLLTLVMTLPGIAVTYNGEEIGMLDNRAISYADTLDPAACNLGHSGNWMEESRDPERTPFQWNGKKFAGFMPANATEKPWLPIHPNYREVNVELQQQIPRSTLNFYKQLLQLRKENTFTYGSFNSVVLKENVFAYVRALKESDTYVVLINFGARDEQIDISELLPEELELAAVGSDSCYKQSERVKAKEVILRKYDTIILKAAHSHETDTGAGSSIIANIVLTFGLLTVTSIARFIF